MKKDALDFIVIGLAFAAVNKLLLGFFISPPIPHDENSFVGIGFKVAGIVGCFVVVVGLMIFCVGAINEKK